MMDSSGIAKRVCSARIIASESWRRPWSTSQTLVREPITPSSADSSKTELLEPKEDGVHGIRRLDGCDVLLLVLRNERDQDLGDVALFRARTSPEHASERTQRSLVVPLGVDWTNLDGFHRHTVVTSMLSYCRLVPCNVENDPVPDEVGGGAPASCARRCARGTLPSTLRAPAAAR